MRKYIMGTLAASLLISATASAQFAIDSRYTDSNGDLTADTPTDASKQIDPSTLIFAYTPVEDPAVYADVWSEFIDHVSNVTGKKVQFSPSSQTRRRLKPCVQAVCISQDLTQAQIRSQLLAPDLSLLP